MSTYLSDRITVPSDYVCPCCYLGCESLSRYQDPRHERLEADCHLFDLRHGKPNPDGTIDHSVADGKRRLPEGHGVGSQPPGDVRRRHGTRPRRRRWHRPHGNRVGAGRRGARRGHRSEWTATHQGITSVPTFVSDDSAARGRCRNARRLVDGE